MKRYFLILLMACSTAVGLSQSLTDLDLKRGIKEFKLGDAFSKWQNSLQYNRTKGVATTYQFTGNKGNLFNTYPIYTIELTFQKSVLTDITITLEKWKEQTLSGGMPIEDYKLVELLSNRIQVIGSRLELLFGNASKTVKPAFITQNGEILWNASQIWLTKKTSLVVHLLFAELNNTGVIAVSMSDAASLIKGETDGF